MKRLLLILLIVMVIASACYYLFMNDNSTDETELHHEIGEISAILKEVVLHHNPHHSERQRLVKVCYLMSIFNKQIIHDSDWVITEPPNVHPVIVEEIK